MDGFTRKREMIQTVACFFVLKFSAFNLICRLRCFKIKVIKHCGTGSTDRQRGKSRNESVENSPVSEEELGETMASIRDVAIKAGVGIGTVSRALNGSGYISDETKQKIMQAVEELNYKPNELAQNLFHNKSGFIGIVVTNLSHPFMTSLVKHVENNLYTNGYKCMLCEVGDNPNRIEEFVEMLQRNVMDGILRTPLDENGNYKPLNPDYKNFGEARINSTTCRGSMIVQNEYYDTVCGYTFDAVKLLEMQKENGKDDIMEEYDTIPRVLMTQEEIQRLAQIQPTISDIVDRYITTWVTGGVDDASWDSYKTELEGAGLNELVEIYQGAVDRAASAAN